jgi:hypothetical protein
VSTLYASKHPGREFEAGFADAFGVSPPDKLNQSHELMVVASELDPSTERIIAYLSQNYRVPINAVFFRYFRDGANEYLARTWLIDPQEAEVKVAKPGPTRGAEPWNGKDFYVNVGDDRHRSWEDCVRYGFVSAGGGRFYSQSLSQLEPGHRVFAYVPSVGYVGVGTVEESVLPLKEFRVRTDAHEAPLLELPLKAPDMAEHVDNPELSEYLVRVNWQKTVPLSQAYREKGLFANQNTVCKLRNRFTLERLAQRFGLEE